MPGPLPTDRVPAESARLRRLQHAQNEFVDFIGAGSVIQVDDDGFLVVILRDDGGLENDAGELAILLDPADDGLLTLSTGGLKIDEDELYSQVQHFAGIMH